MIHSVFYLCKDLLVYLLNPIVEVDKGGFVLCVWVNDSAYVVKGCVAVSVSKEKKCLFYTISICTPEFQKRKPPCFLCTAIQGTEYISHRDILIVEGLL